jgi:hypothetical protein
LDEASVGKEGHVLTTERPALDFDHYEARTWRSDLRLWVRSPEWRKGMETFIVSRINIQETTSFLMCLASNPSNSSFSPTSSGLWPSTASPSA